MMMVLNIWNSKPRVKVIAIRRRMSPKNVANGRMTRIYAHVLFPIVPCKNEDPISRRKKGGWKGERLSNGHDNRAPSPDSRLQEMC